MALQWENGAWEIYQFRVKHDLVPKELAHYLGVTAATVNKWEKGKHNPPLIAKTALLGVVVKMKLEKMEREKGQHKMSTVTYAAKTEKGVSEDD